MQSNIENIIFDLDGTLLDNYRRHESVYIKIALQISGLRHLAFDDAWTEKRSGKSWKSVLSRHLTADELEKFVKHWASAIEGAEALQNDRMFPQVTALLKSRGKMNLLLFTARRDEGRLMEQLEQLGIIDVFQGIYVTKGAAKKNMLTPFKSLAAESTILVGDTEDDSEAAASLGVRFYATTYGLRDKLFWDARKVEDQISTPAELFNFFEPGKQG